jgi:predicted  nucleic acid-binding Zn-ribbon protein
MEELIMSQVTQILQQSSPEILAVFQEQTISQLQTELLKVKTQLEALARYTIKIENINQELKKQVEDLQSQLEPIEEVVEAEDESAE